MFRYLAPDGPRVPGLLGDQAWTATLCLDAYEVAGRPRDFERAQSLARFMLERLAADDGGFYDTPREHETLGRLSSRQQPVKENSVAATVFLRLARMLHDAQYEDVARRTLRQYAHVAESQGHFAAEYAKAVDVLLNPGADIKIVTTAGDGSRLHAAALAIPVADRIVRVIDASDRQALEREGLPPHPAPAAYACYGTLCSAPVTTPGDLFEIVDRTRQAYESTRRAEPLAGPRGGGMAGD
jgi:uncharacterized protein YyaL (SSP411 family)